jgi:hypothetical protein
MLQINCISDGGFLQLNDKLVSAAMVVGSNKKTFLWVWLGRVWLFRRFQGIEPSTRVNLIKVEFMSYRTFLSN